MSGMAQAGDARGDVFDPRFTGRAAAPVIPAEGVDEYAVRVLTVGMAASIFSQKIGIAFGGSFLEITILLIWAVIGWMLHHGRLEVSTWRAALYAATFGLGLLSAGLSPSPGVPALLLAAVCASPFIFVMPTNAATQRAVLANFQKLALVGVGLVVLDHVCQLAGLGMPNLEKLVPESLLYGGFNYIQPIVWRSAFSKPNAIFFLEASSISQFLACALVIELAVFRRMRMILVLGAGMMAVFAGTGFVVLLACLPAYIRKWLTPRSLTIGIAAVVVLIVVALATGWGDMMTARTREFGEHGQSGNARFVAPFEAIWYQFTEAPLRELLVGYGPGSQERDAGEIMLVTPAKMLMDYGAPVMLAYTLFALVFIFSGAYPAVSVALFVIFYLLNGSPAQPVMSAYAFFLTSVYAIRRPGARTAGLGPLPGRDLVNAPAPQVFR